MWVKKYNKSGSLTESVQLNENGETVSLYSIHGDGYLKINVWGGDKELSYQTYDEEVELIEENRGTIKFFRCVLKNKKGVIDYPKTTKSHFAMSNGDIINFNIDKKKLQKWKTKAKKMNCQNKMKTI